MSIWNHCVCRPLLIRMHFKCRNTEVPYLNSALFRFPVPDEKVSWESSWPEYSPIEFTHPSVHGKPWADPDNVIGLKFNTVDGIVNRKSHERIYSYDSQFRPINPKGRTGMAGRGILGRWGPNHAADPIVSRMHNGKLQFVAIRRRDSGEWAIPGGMVDPGETVSLTLKREFGEEALGGKKALEMETLWNNGTELYKGYVDDPRNTDNAWTETVVVHFHDEKGIMQNVMLQAGDDACSVRWVDVDSNEPLYASHETFIDLLRKRFLAQ